jgi:arylsulfatase A-like enzyme
LLLQENGQLDRTVIVFTSDNGFVLNGEHGGGQADHVRGQHPRPAAGALPPDSSRDTP